MVVPRCFLNFPTDRLFPNWLAFLENQRKDAGYSEVIQKIDSKGEKEFLHLVSNFLQGRFTEAQSNNIQVTISLRILSHICLGSQGQQKPEYLRFH